MSNNNVLLKRTGKSTVRFTNKLDRNLISEYSDLQFIHLITGDENIEIGHDVESHTDSINVSCYFDEYGSLSTTLVDTPGFDDSRDGHSDVEILRKISDFLLKE